jgi:trigger factor
LRWGRSESEVPQSPVFCGLPQKMRPKNKKWSEYGKRLCQRAIDFIFDFRYLAGMPIKKEITRLEKSVVRLAVTIPKDELREMYAEAVDELAKTIQIAGFRKGKAPRSVIERKLGAALQEDLVNDFAGKAVKSILEDASFPEENLPLQYSPPMIDGDVPKLDLENDFKFAVTWDVKPVFEVKAWKGFTVEVADVKVEKADVDRELERVRERNAIVMDRQPEEAARPGDIVKIDYVELDEKGEKIAGTEQDGAVFTLNPSEESFRWFEDDVVGMKVGETKTVTKEVPANEEDAKSGEKTEKYSAIVTVTAIKEKKLPELDDDLAQDVHEDFKTLDDLKKSIQESLNSRLEDQLKQRKLDLVLGKLVENNPVDLPESMIRYEMELRIIRMAQNMGLEERRIEEMLRDKTHLFRMLVENQRETIAKSLKAAMIQDQLISDLGIEATDEDREAELKTLAEQEETDFDKLKEDYRQGDQLASLNKFIVTKKMQEMLFKENTVTTGAKQSFEEFMGGNL